jgi:hypothetical protein
MHHVLASLDGQAWLVQLLLGDRTAKGSKEDRMKPIEIALDVIRAFSTHPPQEHQAKETYNRALKLVSEGIEQKEPDAMVQIREIIDKLEWDEVGGTAVPAMQEVGTEQLAGIYLLAGGKIEKV